MLQSIFNALHQELEAIFAVTTILPGKEGGLFDLVKHGKTGQRDSLADTSE